MSKDIKEMIDKVKNFKQFVNEDVEVNYTNGDGVEYIYTSFKVPTNINGKKAIYRNAKREESDNIINGGTSGEFWRGEPKEYRNFGDVIIVTTEPDSKEVSKVESRGNREENDSYNYVGYTVNIDSTLIIIDKITDKVIFTNVEL